MIDSIRRFRPLAGSLASAGLLSTLLVLSMGFAQATTVNSLDLPDLAQKADVIADVTVTNAQSYIAYSAEGRSIHTRVTLTLNGLAIKGNVSSPFTLDFLGGTVGGEHLQVQGAPQPQIGQRLIIFAHSPTDFYVSPFIGVHQGAMRVVHDESTNSDRVFRWWGEPVKESEPMSSHNTSNQQITAETLRSAEATDHFLQRVKDSLNH